ncbi:MAG: hypothetical protein LBS85_07490 [Clostridiales Family XIII bacterium]|nr:hypothetical protein [Clostridiales Family XIII bacterium]
MKKILVFVLVLVFVFSFAACGGSGTGSAGGGADDSGKVDPAALAEDILEDAIAENSFSEAAGAAAIKKLGGVDEKDIAPDWDWTTDDSTMQNYGDVSDYGHGSLLFIKKSADDLTQEEYLAWAQKVYDATAKASELGYNCYGWNVGDGSNPDGEISFDEAMGVGSEAWIFMPGWCYKYNGKYLWVNIEQVKNPENEEMTDDFRYHYYGVNVDISVGMQKSWGEYEEEIDAAFEEYGDEIEDALKDYAN